MYKLEKYGKYMWQMLMRPVGSFLLFEYRATFAFSQSSVSSP
jgi:hypothetical protein